MDLEMGVSRVMAALEVAGPDPLWEDCEETRTKLESEAKKLREMAVELRRKHLL